VLNEHAEESLDGAPQSAMHHVGTMRLAVLQFTHETVTFLPNDTTRDDFVYPGSPATGAALLATDPKGYMGGFVQLAQEYDGVELVGITSPLWPRTGIGSGWVTQDAFAHFLGVMLAELEAGAPFDGVYLALHGAMAVRGVPRPEAEIARRVRTIVGPGVPIAATFDPHGNEDAAYLDHADMAQNFRDLGFARRAATVAIGIAAVVALLTDGLVKNAVAAVGLAIESDGVAASPCRV